MAKPELELSVIVPLYNEYECVERMYKALVNALDPLNLDFEIIFVDDGSVDDTYKIARTLSVADPRLRVIKFRRNYGQTPAMAAGIDNARGKVLVTMDGDLQNDPTDIPRFLSNSSVTSSIRFDVTIQALNSFFRCVTSTNGRKSYHPLIALRFKIAHWCS